MSKTKKKDSPDDHAKHTELWLKHMQDHRDQSEPRPDSDLIPKTNKAVQQDRHNAGKPKLSYLFANERALAEMLLLEGEPVNLGRPVYVSAYLNGGSRALLAKAAWWGVAGLQFALTGNSVGANDFLELCSLCPEALAEICAVADFGEGKYARGNYRKGAPVTEYCDSGLRHELATQALDSESGKHHLAHAFWNYWQALNQPEDRDDRLPRVAFKDKGLPPSRGSK